MYLPRYRRLTPRAMALVVSLTLLLLLTILVRRFSEYNFFGFQDEGILLTYPDLMLRGYTPYVDFATGYTPGGYYLLAGIYGVFGETVSVERATGVVYWFLALAAIFLIGMRVSRATAILSSLTALAYVSLFDAPAALPHFPAYATMLFAIFLVAMSWDEGTRAPNLFAFFGGTLAGASIWFKQDIGVVASIAAVAGLAGLDLARLRHFLLGFTIPVLGLLVFVISIGTTVFIDNVFVGAMHVAPGVVLPITPNMSVIVTFFCTCVAIGAAYLAYLKRVPQHEQSLTRSIAVMSTGLSLAALHRFGPHDVSYLGVPIVSLTLVSTHIVIRAYLTPDYWRTLLATYFGLGLVPVLIGHLAWEDSSGVRISEVFSANRVVPWPLFTADGTAPQPILDGINASSKAGEKLFVGPRDLRFTVQNDAVLYYLLPKLRPASRYIEMSAGRANRFDSGLAEELTKADWVILTSEFDNHVEPNASRIPGSEKPNDVIRSHFCLRSRYGSWQLLQHCS